MQNLLEQRDNNFAVSSISLELPSIPSESSKDLTIRTFSVRENEEGRGFGSMVLDEAIKFARNLGMAGITVWAHEPKAKGFYIHKNFQILKGENVDSRGNTLFRLQL
jgi:GNAT superfamily N-acetyltransferase